MKIAILETEHFQYTLTQSSLFPDCEQIIITTSRMYADMVSYHSEISAHKFVEIDTVAKDEEKIFKTISDNQIDILFISPIFDSYQALNRLVKKIKCKKVLTIHNINTWFYGRFWSLNSLKVRLNMRSIIKNCDYIAVEDFIFNHLKNSNNPIYKKFNIIYIPYTLFHSEKQHKYTKTDNKLKIVLTGGIDGNRRRYEEVLTIIDRFKSDKDSITFSFAGQAFGEYGLNIQSKLRKIKEEIPGYVNFFENDSTAEMFRREMETSDIILSTSTETYKGMGTLEYIGKTKPTAAIHDMMTYQLPGLLPKHLSVPKNLEGSVFNYIDAENLYDIIRKLLRNPKELDQLKQKAALNSWNFTANKIRKGLPF